MNNFFQSRLANKRQVLPVSLVLIRFLFANCVSAEIPQFYTRDASYLSTSQAAFPSYALTQYSFSFVRFNKRGDMIGYLHDNNASRQDDPRYSRAFAYVQGKWYDLRSAAGDAEVTVQDINEFGDVVGFFQNTGLNATANPGGDNSYWSLFFWRDGSLQEWRNPEAPNEKNTFFQMPAARINSHSQVIATRFDYITLNGGHEMRDFAIEPFGTLWTIASGYLLSINNLQEIVGVDSAGPWDANSPLAVCCPIVRVLDPPKNAGANALPLLITDGGEIFWDTGDLTTRSGSHIARAPFLPHAGDGNPYQWPKANSSELFLPLRTTGGHRESRYSGNRRAVKPFLQKASFRISVCELVTATTQST